MAQKKTAPNPAKVPSAVVAAVAPPPPAMDAGRILTMIQGMGQQSAVKHEASGQSINQGTVSLPPVPAAPRPIGQAGEDPAVPSVVQQEPPAPDVSQPGPNDLPVIPGQRPAGEGVLQEELTAVNRRLAELELAAARAEDARQEEATAARISQLSEEERPAAWLEHEKMRRHQAEIRLAEVELAKTHPLYVRVMGVIAKNADIEVDAPGYRALADVVEPLLRDVIQQGSSDVTSQMQQQIQKEWGVRPTPDQAKPPAPDDPIVTEYKRTRDAVRKRPTDVDAMRRMIAAGTRLKEAGLDPSQVV